MTAGTISGFVALISAIIGILFFSVEIKNSSSAERATELGSGKMFDSIAKSYGSFFKKQT